jgi:hypothetical protein
MEFAVWWLYIQSGQFYVGVTCMLPIHMMPYLVNEKFLQLRSYEM